jgi:predicted nucleotidyltransferase
MSAVLSQTEREALAEITHRVSERFPVDSYVIFGSRARGDHRPDSDIDLLIVTQRELTMAERLVVSRILHDINMRRGTFFCRTIVDKDRWTGGALAELPIHRAVEREGVLV